MDISVELDSQLGTNKKPLCIKYAIKHSLYMQYWSTDAWRIVLRLQRSIFGKGGIWLPEKLSKRSYSNEMQAWWGDSTFDGLVAD